MPTFLAGLREHCGATTAMLPRDAAIEAKIEKLLEQMSLDEKIGQMVELEIGMITYRDPRYVVEKLARMSEQELADTLRRFGARPSSTMQPSWH